MSLYAVDALLQEFYQPTTPNGRKKEIEAELVAFKQKADSWQICLRETIALESNQFLWFFCASTVSHTITRRWSFLSANERSIMRETLWKSYANLPSDCVGIRRQRDTIAQLIAFMGKREFPEENNYMLHCIELVKTKFSLGINLLRITSEEVVSNREDVTSDRKNYFHSCVSVYTPEIMDLMTKYLLIAVCHINNRDIHSIPNVLMDYNLTASLPNDNQFCDALLDLLHCVQHLVSWISTDLITDYFLMSILDLSQYRINQADQSLAALSVLNEILYLQKPLPCAITLMNGLNGLLEHHNATKPQNEMYIDKFRELLRLYAIKYWPKLLHDDGALLQGFLHSLFLCTICKNGALDFTEKLEIWTPIVKGLLGNDKIDRYSEVILQLVAVIMQRIQFEHNKAELELLDNESVEDNLQTEWQHFLTQCIECVALIATATAEARPNAVFTQVSNNWSRLHIYLNSLEHDIDCGKNIELVRKLRCPTFSEHLKDFSTICQALARVATSLDVDKTSQANSTDVNSQLSTLCESLMDILKFFTRNKLTQLKIDRTTFQADYDYLFAQILMAIRSIIPLSSALRNGQSIQALLVELGGIFSPNTSYSSIVYMSASQLLLCISTVIRPKYLLEAPTIMSLMQTGPSLSYLPPEVITNIYISLISYLVLPWRNVENVDHQQDYQRRCAILKEYISCLAQNLLQFDSNDRDTKIPATFLTQISNFDVVITFFKDSSNTSKDMLASAFKPIITKVLMIYNGYGLSNNLLANAVATFSLSILYTLSAQLGSQFVKEMITLFINVSTRDLSSANYTVLEKILQMFQAIVEQPGNASLSMLPSILDFTIQHVFPIVQQDNINSCDIVSNLYSLLDSILNCKWQYFYKSNIQHNGSLFTSTGGENLHSSHFTAIMNAYGQVVVSGSDPNIVRQVLQSMQNVNERWRLYQRPLFKENLLASFQAALINLLISGEGAIHFELLANALFAMGQVDTLKLRECFMTTGFPINMKIIDEICLSTDIPTFTQKLTQLIQDTHCVHMSQLQA